MAGVKITNFLGIAPKISPELLPNTAAQIAKNCKLYSGDLIPYPQPVIVANTGQTGTIKTIYALQDTSTSPNTLKWLSWAGNVDIAVASKSSTDDQRFYYTGDGIPKVSNYELAISGAAPYPNGYYDLGLPVPPKATVVTTVAAPFVSVASSTYARDTGNIVTLVTAAAHNLKTGSSITVTGFAYNSGTYALPGGTTVNITITAHGLASGATVTLDFTSGDAIDGAYTVTVTGPNAFQINTNVAPTTAGNVRWDIRNINAANVVATVVDSTTITYYSPGEQITTTSSSNGLVNLGGNTQVRSYVFTWITPWDEESIASKPSDNLYIKEGRVVTVSNIPTVKPTGNNFIRGVRLYRTLASTSGTDYFSLGSLWFPTGIASVQRTSNVSRVATIYPHNLDFEERFKISGCTVASFDITGGIVTDVIDAYTFEYAQVAADEINTIVAAGTMYHDVSENPPTTTARYWGDGSYDFVDDFDSLNLLDILSSDNYDPPPENLEGLIAVQNNFLAGFVGNTIYFSEVAAPHAWPIDYSITLEHEIIGLASINGSILALTIAYPYIISGSDPAATMSVSRVDAEYSCLNRKSITTMAYGVVWATHDGLAVYSGGAGPQLVTKLLYNGDTWTADLDPTTIVAEHYNGLYFASHSTGAIIFDQDPKVGGNFVDSDYTYSAIWHDSRTDRMYYSSGTNGDIYRWDDISQPLTTQDWKSKVIITKEMINLGAARVIADYTTTTSVWDNTTTAWDSTTILWDSADNITFTVWADKQQIYTTSLGDSSVIRLPTGYRTDTFEVGVSGNVRVRAIHLAETPLGLITA